MLQVEEGCPNAPQVCVRWSSHRFSPAFRSSRGPFTCLTQLLDICNYVLQSDLCIPSLFACTDHRTAHILSCYGNKNTDVTNNINGGSIPFECLKSSKNWKLEHLNEMQTSIMLLVATVLSFQWQTKMSSVKKSPLTK